MSSSNIKLKLDPDRIKEMPMVDLAFEVLKSANTPYYYRDLILEIAKIRGFSPDEINGVIAQVYTEINIDGRFACVGNNMWGLKRWYPIERSDDPIGNAKHPRIINDDDDLDDEDFAEEEEEYTAEDDEFGAYDEEHDEFEEAEDDTEVEEDVELDDEVLGEEEEEEDLSDDESDLEFADLDDEK